MLYLLIVTKQKILTLKHIFTVVISWWLYVATAKCTIQAMHFVIFNLCFNMSFAMNGRKWVDERDFTSFKFNLLKIQ